MEKNEVILLSPKLELVAKKLNNSVAAAIGNSAVLGFEKAYLISSAIKDLKALLTKEYMQPIMELQGNKLGFKTDKDKEGGYSEDVVKNCLIEAVLMGIQPCGNQFNIIAGNMYATKEGVGYLLSKIEGLSYDIVAELPRIKDASSAIVMNIEWTIGGITKTKKLDIPVKVNNFMGTDAIIGKATRKARKWLYDTITGCEIPEGDVVDTTGIVISTTHNKPESTIDKENERIVLMISDCKTFEDLELLQSSNPEINADLFLAQKERINAFKTKK